MDNNNMKMVKEAVYNVLQKPTRENFIDILSNGFGEQDNLDFKGQWNDYKKKWKDVKTAVIKTMWYILLGIADNREAAKNWEIAFNEKTNLWWASYSWYY